MFVLGLNDGKSMATTICIFEDTNYTQLLPLVYFRPVYNLKCGILSLKEKLFRAYPEARVVLHTRSYLADYMRLRNPGLKVNEVPSDQCLFVNGRVIADEDLSKMIPLKLKQDMVYVHGDQIVAARVGSSHLKRIKKSLNGLFSASDFEGLPTTRVHVELVKYPWDLVHRNGVELRKDFESLAGKKSQKRIHGKVDKGAHVLNERNVFLGEGSVVKPGAVIDAEDGPVYIGRNVKIFPQATIVGPASIGDGSLVKIGTQIYGETSIGPLCKVGGEIEESIIHGYSNKQHHGFLGHSYLGAWVNLGAGTTNSDLKNNYGPVRVSLGGEPIDTGLQFVGLTVGDHSKTAINSMFNTGTVIGVSSNIFGDGFPPKYVPSFSWGAAGETFTTYTIDRAIDVARRVMARRNVILAPSEEQLFRRLFELTSDDRRRRGMPN